uniref:hypothetical protein n=1 Tax=Xanthobacter dioxanivorans TaxID=2528964 RepID=UPI0038CD83C7
MLVYAKTSPEKGDKGISAFIVETDNPGFKVAQKLNKMGFRGSPGRAGVRGLPGAGGKHGGQTGRRCGGDDVRARS